MEVIVIGDGAYTVIGSIALRFNECIEDEVVKVTYPAINGPVSLQFQAISLVNKESLKNVRSHYALITTNSFPEENIQKIKEIIQIIPRRTKIALVLLSDDAAIENISVDDLDVEFISVINPANGEGAESIVTEFAYANEDLIQIDDPKNIVRKFKKYLELIKTRKVIKFIDAKDMKVCRHAKDTFDRPTLDESLEWTDLTIPYEFGETRYDWLAFKGKLIMPEEFSQDDHVIKFRLTVKRNYLVRTWDDDSPAGPEGRFWIDEKPTMALDEFHDGGVIDIEKDSDCEAIIFSGRCPAKHSVTRFGMELISKPVEELERRLSFLIELLEVMKPENPDRMRIVRLVDFAVRQLDISQLSYPIPLKDIRKHPDNFESSVYSALKILRSIKNLRAIRKTEADAPQMSVIGYSHIDTCWLWPFSITKHKVVNTTTSMLHLLEHPPHGVADSGWNFLATASIHYDFLREKAPDLLSRCLASRRWEVDGAMFLESDTNSPCGESLIRQFLIGMRSFDSMNREQHTLVLPDCFGFTQALPQIMLGFGIDSFLTSKISWCEYNEFPYSTFRWRGVDGSEVLAHFITTPSSWSYQTSTYTGTATVRELVGTFDCYKQRDVCRSAALHTMGNGDGGGGVTEEMVWNVALLKELPPLSGVPRPVFQSLKELFDGIRLKRRQLPVWDDELYLEYHRGTYTSQEEVKRQNRALEAKLRALELIASVLVLKGADVSEELSLIDGAWRDALLCQFHDALPGSSINEANCEIIEVGAHAFSLLGRAEEMLAPKFSAIYGAVVINPSSLPSKRCPSFGWSKGASGKRERFYETDFYERSRDGLDTEKVRVLRHGGISPLFEAPAEDSPLKLEVDERGIRSARVGDTEFISAEELGLFRVFEDRPIAWPAWDIQRYVTEMEDEPPKLSLIKRTESGIEMEHRIAHGGDGDTVIKTRITFASEYPVADLDISVDWREHDKLLRLCVPTNIRARNARFGVQFGHIERPTHDSTQRDMARFEVYGRWADLSDGRRGVSVMSDVKAGFAVRDGTICLSLLKAPMQTDKWCDFGRRHFAVRLLFHDGPFDSLPAALADALQNPPISVSVSVSVSAGGVVGSGGEEDEGQIASVEGAEGIFVDWVKPAEDLKSNSIVVRMHEGVGGATKAALRIPVLDRFKAHLADLRDRPLKELEVVDGKVLLEFSAFHIVSVLITPIV